MPNDSRLIEFSLYASVLACGAGFIWAVYDLASYCLFIHTHWH